MCRLRYPRQWTIALVYVPQLYRQAIKGLVLSGLLAASVQAYTVVQISTASAPGLEKSFIAATTAQFTASVFSNPFVANTYQIKLFGPNPNYDPPPTNQQLLDSLVTVDSYTYVYGWASGMQYERNTELGAFIAPIGKIGYTNGGYFVNCSSAAYFNGLQYSTMTQQLVDIDSTTCNAVLSAVFNSIYEANFSTPTTVSGF